MRLPAVVRLLRPQQWAKNLLLFLPALAAHSGLQRPHLLLGFFAFCAAASAGYVLNDMLDIESDKKHNYRKQRVLASGEMDTPAAFLLGIGCVVIAIIAARPLPELFQLTLLTYLILNVSYSALLKRIAVIDVILLAAMYSVRLVAGSVLADVPLSRWFLAFSTFFFLSLALCKRVVELKASGADMNMRRGYVKEDLVALTALGAAAGIAAALVYCLYITGDDALRLYSRPDLLWAGLPIFLYWLSRTWLFVGRGTMHDDPVVFALTDKATIALVLIFGAVIWLAI